MKRPLTLLLLPAILWGCGPGDLSKAETQDLESKLGKPMTQSGMPGEGAGAKPPAELPNGGKPKGEVTE